MPIEKLQTSMLQQQLHNAQVKQNLTEIHQLAQQQPPEQLIESLKHWQGSPVLQMNNTLFWSLLGIAITLIILLIYFPIYPWLWLLPFALLFFAFYKKEKNTARDELIHHLKIWTLQHRYNIEFNTKLADDQLAEFKHQFPLFSLGNYENELEDGVSGTFLFHQQAYPFCLFRYHYVDESSSTDDDGRTTYSYQHYDRWGIFISDLAFQGISISTQQKRACRLGQKWTTSDIQFNKRYQLSGNNEMNLARFFTPARILILDKMMAEFKGDLYLHPQQEVMCWLFKTDILKIAPKTPAIETTQQFADFLQQVHLPEFEHLCDVLMPFLEKFD